MDYEACFRYLSSPTGSNAHSVGSTSPEFVATAECITDVASGDLITVSGVREKKSGS